MRPIPEKDQIQNNVAEKGNGILKRIQYKKGKRLPEKTVYVGRPSMYGNPFKVRKTCGSDSCKNHAQQWAVDKFKLWLDGKFDEVRPDLVEQKQKVLTHIKYLRGKDLACWCEEGTPCHGDILIKMASS